MLFSKLHSFEVIFFLLTKQRMPLPTKIHCIELMITNPSAQTVDQKGQAALCVAFLKKKTELSF